MSCVPHLAFPKYFVPFIGKRIHRQLHRDQHTAGKTSTAVIPMWNFASLFTNSKLSARNCLCLCRFLRSAEHQDMHASNVKQTKTNLKASVWIKFLKWTWGVSPTIYLLLLWLNAEPIWSFPCLLPVVEFRLKNSHPVKCYPLGFGGILFFFISLSLDSILINPKSVSAESVSTYCGERWKLTEIHWPAFIIFSISFFFLNLKTKISYSEKDILNGWSQMYWKWYISRTPESQLVVSLQDEMVFL